MKKSYVYGVLFGLLSFALFMFGLEKTFSSYNFALFVSFVIAGSIGFGVAFFEIVQDAWKDLIENDRWREVAVGTWHTIAVVILYWSSKVNTEMIRADEGMGFMRAMIGHKDNVANVFPLVMIFNLMCWIILCYIFIHLLKTDYLYKKHNPWNEVKRKEAILDPIDNFTKNEYLWRIVATIISAVIVSFFSISLLCIFFVAFILIVTGLVLGLITVALPDAPKYIRPLCITGFFLGGIIAIMANDYARGKDLMTFLNIGLGAWGGLFVAQTAVMLGKMTSIKNLSTFLEKKVYH